MDQLMLVKFSLGLQELIFHHDFDLTQLLIWFARWVP